MKTSNKILLGLIVIIFAVPLLLAYTLRNKIDKGEYTIEKNYRSEGQRSKRSGSFTAFKVVKVVAPGPGFLTCHLKPSNTMNYQYYNDRKDSIIVSNSNDTLYISYLGEKGSVNQGRREHGDLSIEVSLPPFNNLVVDGAAVIFDSLPASMSNLSVTIKNKAVIIDGSKTTEQGAPGFSRVNNDKKPEASQIASADKMKVVDDSDKGGLGIFQSTTLQMPDFNMRDFLISCLLGRIS